MSPVSTCVIGVGVISAPVPPNGSSALVLPLAALTTADLCSGKTRIATALISRSVFTFELDFNAFKED